MQQKPSIQPVFKDIQQRIIEELNTAKHSIYIAVAWFTDKSIFEIIKQKSIAGLDIHVIVDNNDANLEHAQSQYESLRIAGVELDLIGPNVDFGKQMHNKFCVVDWETVITGSYNWSRNAQTNEENVIIVKDGETAKKYLDEFDRIKEEFCQEHGRVGEFVNWFKRKIYRILNDKPPIIELFQSNSLFLSRNQPVTFTWLIKNDFTNIFLNEIEVTGKTQHTISAGNETEFYLKVINTEWQEHRGILQTTSQPIYVEIDSTPATIINFSSNKLFVKNQEAILLSWEVDNAVKIELVGHGEMEENDFEIVPTEDTIYILRAFAFNGKYVEQQIAIETDKTPPNIIQFSADRNFIEDRNPAFLNWKIEGAVKANIPQVGAIDYEHGACEVFPRRDTKYLLSATSFYGVVASKEITIEVSKQPPVILDFSADSYLLMDSTPAKLTWLIEGAEQIKIDNNIGDVTDLEFVKVHNMVDTTYTLEAISYFGVGASKKLIITVNKVPPLIYFFRSDKEYILADYSVKLFWEITGAHSVQISGIGSVEPIDELTTSVHSDTNYKLIATNYFGYSSEAELIIRIVPVPLIEKLIVPDIDVRLTTNLEYQPSIETVNFQNVELNIDSLSELNNDLFSIKSPDIDYLTKDQISLSGFIEYFKQEANKLNSFIKNNNTKNQNHE